MKVLLVSPHFNSKSIRPPLGLAYLASVLEKKHNVEIYDLSLHTNDEFESKLQTINPDIVGITCYTPSYSNSMNTAKTVKQLTNAILIMGGAHATILPESCLSDSVDFVIRGEGENTFPELLDSIEHPDSVKGISYKKDGEIHHNEPRPYIQDIDTIPFPARQYLELDKYIDTVNGERFTSILSSRGCPWGCIYCCKSVTGKRWVGMSAERVVSEMKEIKNKYGFNRVHFHDELFTFDNDRVRQICSLLKQRNLNMKWSCVSRVDTIDKELMKEMKSAGCDGIDFGVECGDEAVLRSIKKGIKIPKVKQTFKDAKEVGMTASGYFMLGLPEDTKESMEKTIDLAMELDPNNLLFSIATPYPKTELWDIMEKDGLLKNFTWDDLMIIKERPMFDTKNLTKDEIFKASKSAYRQWKIHLAFRKIKKLFS